MNHGTTRRRFLRMAASAAALGAHASLNTHAQTPIERAGKASLTPALNAYSFSDALEAKLVDLFGVCDFCAKHDIAAVDLTGYFFPGYPKPPADEYVRRIKKYVHDRGVVVCGTGVRNDFATADRAVRAEGVSLARAWVEAAARLGAPVLRVFAGPTGKQKDWRKASEGAPRGDVERWMADDLRACAEHGEKFGVIVAVQNHGDFLSSAEEHLSLLRRVDHPWCGPLVDTGMYTTPDPYADVARMAPHAVNWQIKETLGSSLKSPRADFRRLARAIHDGGYGGFVPIETLKMGRKDYDPAAEVLKVLASMREAIAGLG
ncbi:MAG: sugar phosphate isomerase/epimerase family protein [Isosphaeraceae bacterium]